MDKQINRGKLQLFIIVFFMLLNVTNASNSSILIPINVSELLPEGINGIDRYQEPTSFGIPLKNTDNIQNISQLGLLNTSIGQFRVLSRYPDTNNIEWVLVDTQVSVQANKSKKIYLVNNSQGNFGGDNLATENDSTVLINTGIANFRIKKQNFNVFDSVKVNGTEFISGEGSIVAVNSTGSLFKSSYDANTNG